MRKFFATALCGLLLATGCLLAQTEGMDILDIYKVKVKAGKGAEYEALTRRMADLNRRHGGDRWIAFSTEYGDSGTIYFSSVRPNMAAVETGFELFQKAISAGAGPGGFAKMMNDLSALTETGHGEIRRRRWDLSVNPPSSREEAMKTAAGARWIRSIRIEIKPGKMLDFIAAYKPWQAELARLSPPVSVWASVSETGPAAVTLAMYHHSLAEVDAANASIQALLAGDGYRSYLRSVADTVSSSAWEIHRLRPDLSCVPDGFGSGDPFWTPKMAPRMVAAPKPAEKK